MKSCVWSSFCNTVDLLSFRFSCAIISLGCLIYMCYCCRVAVIVPSLILVMHLFGQWSVIVVFPDHNHLLFVIIVGIISGPKFCQT